MKSSRRFFCSLIALLCFATVSPANAVDSKTKVYILGGIFNIAAGVRVLATKLNQLGIAATVYESDDYDSVGEVIVRDYQSKKVRRVVVVGYSAGAGAAVLMAEKLGEIPLPIDLLITLDPVAEFTVPKNVKRALNFHVGKSLIIGADNVKVDPPGFGHFSIQYSESLHERIIGLIK